MTTRIIPVAAGFAAAVALLTSACTGAPPPAGQPSAKPATLAVDLTEFSVSTATTSVEPGSYTIVATNRGRDVHALTISGPGLADSRIADLRPGQTGSVPVALRPGKYLLYCPLDGHRDRGMNLVLSAGPTGGPSLPESPPPTSPGRPSSADPVAEPHGGGH